jgi:ornithine cyclodeaminase/alanine dehydrogenase-like protein (mu-crystallin family)
VVTATTSKNPVLRREWLGDRVHVSAIGAFYPDWRELDTATVSEAKVVVDSREAIMEEAGDILIPISEGAITEDHIHAELGDPGLLGREPRHEEMARILEAATLACATRRLRQPQSGPHPR